MAFRVHPSDRPAVARLKLLYLAPLALVAVPVIGAWVAVRDVAVPCAAELLYVLVHGKST